MQQGSPALVCATGALGGAISGALALGSSRWIADRLHCADPALVVGDLVGAPTIISFVIGAGVGALAGVLLGLVTMYAARFMARFVFACVLCPAASLCVNVWLLARAVPLVPMLVGSWIYAVCVAFLLPRVRA